MMKLKLLYPVLISLFLTSCGNTIQNSPGNQEQSLSEISSTCQKEDLEGGALWIKGQLEAFADPDPRKAYGFASDEFRSNNSLEQFALIISSGYSMLLNLDSFKIMSCEPSDNRFLFGVEIVDKENSKFAMQYILSKVGNTWGVEAASVTQKLSA